MFTGVEIAAYWTLSSTLTKPLGRVILLVLMMLHRKMAGSIFVRFTCQVEELSGRLRLAALTLFSSQQDQGGKKALRLATAQLIKMSGLTFAVNT